MFSAAQVVDHPLDLVRRPGQDDLVRAVVDGDVDPAGVDGPAGRLDALAVGGDGDQPRRRHVAGRFQAAEDGPQPAELTLQLPVRPQHARGRESQDLAAAVAGHGVRPQAQPGQHLVQRPLRVRRPRSPPSAPTRGRRRPRLRPPAEHVRARQYGVAQFQRDAIGRVELPAHLGEVQAQVGEHPRVLRPLAREQERQAPRTAERLVPVIGAAGVADRHGTRGRPAAAAGRPAGRRDRPA